MSARIEARDLVVNRAGTAILRRASITVAASSIATVEGPSGSGKSTLLKAIATLIPRDGGHLFVDGVDADTLAPMTYRRRVAYVPQEPRMLDGTVADNIEAGPRLAGRRLELTRVRELVASVALPSGFEERPAKDLSGGERQRVALARALANDPIALLLDEPTAALDPESARKVLELAAALAASGLAVLLVTHVEEHAAFLGATPGGARYACRDGEVAPLEDRE